MAKHMCTPEIILSRDLNEKSNRQNPSVILPEVLKRILVGYVCIGMTTVSRKTCLLQTKFFDTF